VSRLALTCRFVRLEPLAESHVDALVAAARDRSTFALAPVPRDRAEMADYVAAALADEAAGRANPFAVVTPQGEVAGSLRFMNFEWWTWPPGPITVAGEPRRAAAGDPPDVVEAGHAWLATTAQRTAVFTAISLLMATHAFEAWKVHRLVLKTDARNARSRAAIERLGGTFEGVLRAHLPAADGVIRDTAMYSIVQQEWAGVRKRLESYLGGPL